MESPRTPPPSTVAPGRDGATMGEGASMVVVIGGCNLDVKARSDDEVVDATSNPGTTVMTPGGVGRNIAENLARLGTRTHLVSVVGSDHAADVVLGPTAASGVRLDHVHHVTGATGSYVAVLDHDGELVVGVADMAATARLDPAMVDGARHLVAAADVLVLDGNLRIDALARAIDLAHAAGTRVVLEPVSVPKARLLADAVRADRPLFGITPNRDELAVLADLPTDTDDDLLAAADRLHGRGVRHVWVRLGARGSVLSSSDGDPAWLPAVAADVAEVTGAGDAMVAAFVHALLAGAGTAGAARAGHAAAAATVASHHTVRPDLTTTLLDELLDATGDGPT